MTVDKERKQQRSVSILPTIEVKIIKKYGSWTKYLTDCLKRDGYLNTKQLTTKTK